MTSKPRAKAATAAEETAADAAAAPPDAAASDAPKKRPAGPSFGMSEGTREELARTGRATDPFTGAEIVDEARLAEVKAEAKRAGESTPRER